MMTLSKKLQIGEAGIRVLHAPGDVALDLPQPTGPESGVLVFVRNRAELGSRVEPALEAARADRLAWIAYPKGGQLGTDLNRDRLWEALEGRGVRPARQVAIDDVWSALRFRPTSE